MKLTHILYGVVSLLVSSLTTFSASIRDCQAYVIVMGDSGSKIELLSDANNKGIQLGKVNAKDKRQVLRFYYKSKTPKQWTNTSFKFKALTSGEVTLLLSAPERKNKDGKLISIAVNYDDIKLNGKLLPNGDFSDDFTTWSKSVYGDLGIVPKIEKCEDINGHGKCVRITRTSQLVKRLSLTKDKIYELSFATRYVGEIDRYIDDVALDFSDSFNNSSKNMKKMKIALPNPKISKEGVVINGIKFKANTSEGKSALIFRSKLLSSEKNEIKIKLTEEQAKLQYLYIIHTISNAFIDNNNSVGRVMMTTKNGRLVKKDIHLDRDAGYQNQVVNGFNATPLQVDGGTVYFSRFKLPEDEKVDTISFLGHYKSPWIVYAGTLSDTKVYPFEIMTPTEDKWTKADITDKFYDVEEGSALDLSHLISTPVPAGSTGRAIVSSRGTIAFEKTPEKDARFKSYSLWESKLFAYIPDVERREFIRNYAKNLRKQGYNLVRIKLDYLKDFADKPRKQEYFDMADFLLSELKKNGIYYQIIFGTYADGRKGYKFGVHNDVKMEIIIGDKLAWQRWKDSAIEFLEHINPYTGYAWKDEPSMLCVEYYNELTNSLGRLYKLRPELQKVTLAKFMAYLKSKYKSVDDLNKAWNDAGFWYKKFEFKSFDEVEEHNIYGRNCDWLAFGWENINKFGKFAEDVVKSTGYKGLVCECNTAATFTALEYANRFADVTIVNSYYSHPSDFSSKDVYCSQKSAIGDYWVENIVSRGFNNRPNSLTEYNYCFWNQHRYEAPVLISPYCAYQNFSVMTIHQDVLPIKRKITTCMGPFAVGASPIMRASELLMSCFFMRGDVKPAGHRVDMKVTGDFLKTLNANKAKNPQQMRIASLTGFRMKYEKMDILSALKNVKVKPADIEISPVGSAQLKQEEWYQEVVADKNSIGFNLEKFVEQLRKQGVFSETNKTNIEKGIFQTDTEQITRDINNLSMTVVTDYSEAVAMKKPEETRLKALKVLSSSQPASIAVCSLDGKKLGESLRMVFVYATQEANENMKLSFDQTYAITTGNKNIMLKNGIVKAELHVDASKKYAVYPLSLNGVRREKLEMPIVDGVMKIAIDNSKLKNGATTMFEIVAE